MRTPIFSLLTCAFTLSNARILDYHDGECPWGAQCMPLDLCPARAQRGLAHALRPSRCASALPVVRACCWDPSALAAPSLPRHRGYRSPPNRPARSTPAPSSPTPTTPRVTTLKPKGDITTTTAPPTTTTATATTTTTTTTTTSKPKSGLSPSEEACRKYRGLKLRRKRSNTRFLIPTLRFKVVAGQKAILAEFPYMVAIGYNSIRGNGSSELTWGCGGSLISEQYVLTAAHCITDAKSQGMRPVGLRTGVTYLSAGPLRPNDYPVQEVLVHPQHRADRKYFDLALLRSQRRVAFSFAERPVCLAPPALSVGANSTLIVAGWGATDRAGMGSSADLKKAELRMVGLDECRKMIPKSSTLSEGVDNSMICAADPKKEADACNGDSGGPLLLREAGVDVLVGVTSFGGRPCAGTRPGVYARVQPQLKWIESVVWQKPSG